jgi:hypothetical protein
MKSCTTLKTRVRRACSRRKEGRGIRGVNASGHPADGEGVLIAGDDDGGSVWLQRDDDVAKLSCPSSLEPLHK